MKILSVKEIASVKLFMVEISEDELDVFERCLRYVYEHFTPDKIEEITGASTDELLGIREDVSELLEGHTVLRSRPK